MRKSTASILTGQDLLSLIEGGDAEAFTEFYSDTFKKLILVADRYVRSVHIAEEIVQDVFVKIWEDKTQLSGINSIQSYLYRSVANASINHINREKNLEKHHLKIAEHLTEEDVELLNEQNELIVLLHQEIAKLPEKCQRVFVLSRLEGKKYKDIAVLLQISEKTVENHMGNALRILRKEVLMRSSSRDGLINPKYFSLLSLFLY